MFVCEQLTNVRIHNVFNDFIMLANTQFVENVSCTLHFSYCAVVLLLTCAVCVVRRVYAVIKGHLNEH